MNFLWKDFVLDDHLRTLSNQDAPHSLEATPQASVPSAHSWSLRQISAYRLGTRARMDLIRMTLKMTKRAWLTMFV